jgi:hypothetical protein
MSRAPCQEGGAHGVDRGKNGDYETGIDDNESACPSGCRFGNVVLASGYSNSDFETAVLGRRPKGGDFISRVRRPFLVCNPLRNPLIYLGRRMGRFADFFFVFSALPKPTNLGVRGSNPFGRAISRFQNATDFGV